MRAKTARSILAALGVTAVMATVAVNAIPAYASAGAVDFFLDDVHMAANGGPGKAYPIFTLEDGTLTNVKLTIDLSELNGIATASFPDASSNCTISGTTATCALPDNTGDGPDGDGNIGMIPIKLVPSAGAVDGVTASISATISADGATSATYKTPVDVIDGPDLTLLQPDVHASLHAGDSTDVPYSVENNGSQSADMITADFIFTSGMSPYQYKNCAYFPVDETEWLADCEFDQSLAPGASLEGTLPLSVNKDAALEEAGIIIVSPGPASDNSMRKRWSKVRSTHLGRSQSKLSLKTAKNAHPNADDIDESDNFGTALFDVKTSLDLAASGQSVSGDVGAAAKLTVGVVNNGPASMNPLTTYGDNDDTIVGFLVKVPSWASVVKAPENCAGRTTATGSDHPGKAGYAYYYCSDNLFDPEAGVWMIPVGGRYGATLSLKITKADGADGTVTADTANGAAKTDTDASNNVAPITLAASGEPSLPITGSKAGLIAGGGAVLILLGGFLLVLGRRRRRTAAI
jgi:hypothetical protein